MGWFSLAAVSAAVLASLVTADTCASVKRFSDIESFERFQEPYTTEQAEYWSSSCSALKPSCIIFPSTAREVANILNILNHNYDHFAIKSGGHNPNDYFASIAGGPLISTKKLDKIVLDPETGRIRVGPGNRWDDVAAALDGTGWTAVGGRVGNVGVGGYLLGGGLSFLSLEYGLAMSSILEMEVVLANGKIVTASETENADLFRVLKGGGNSFGIVTSFLLQGYKQGQVYGGNLIFARTEETDAKLLNALRDFTEYNSDDKAAIILTASRASTGMDAWIMFIFYDGPTPPAGTFDEFTNVGPISNTVKTQSYNDLITGNNAFVLKGIVNTIATETVPLPSAANAAEVLGGIHQYWRNISESAMDVDSAVTVIGFQPFPKRMAKITREKGLDLLDMDDKVDRLLLEINYSYLLQTDTKKIDRIMKRTFSGIRDRVLEWQHNGVLKRDAFLPLFMNGGYYSQDYFGRLRPELRRLAKKVAAKVDPYGLFKYRTGGFKL
ncbi:hypothetical protein EDB81DRAFT_785523 [Dactylonectria macrodidyma]|uniref:FAD-binding PCMH-type domain-containing protein n=1 Tax=Dactylonectria macrodidyma TaxID=307937 RepID=A0A9P9FHK2_9HYPO|nr:hypothetical protein EDB81DRAFT_785523 [Dactylonectria macrodidyma]